MLCPPKKNSNSAKSENDKFYKLETISFSDKYKLWVIICKIKIKKGAVLKLKVKYLNLVVYLTQQHQNVDNLLVNRDAIINVHSN